jgi:signal transduction histidine kinase
MTVLGMIFWVCSPPGWPPAGKRTGSRAPKPADVFAGAGNMRVRDHGGVSGSNLTQLPAGSRQTVLPGWWRPVFLTCAAAVIVPVALLVPQHLPVMSARLVGAALVGLQMLAVWWTGRRPFVGVTVALAAGTGLQVLHPSVGPGIALIVLCTIAWVLPVRTSLWALVTAMALFVTAAAVDGSRVAIVLGCAGPLLAWSWGALGRAAWARRRAEARRAVLEERARIARELHDVLAHTVSVMVVQAAVADDVFDADPAQARQAVRRMESYGREAMGELRRLLRTVRLIDEPVEAHSERQPGLVDIDRLVESLSGTGLEVVVRSHGVEGAGVPPGVQVSAYRIVQESLTNTLRHAGAQRAEVELRLVGGELVVEVRDDGRPPASRPARAKTRPRGHGIVGMRERAASVSGSLEAGPDPAGGFRVRARLPLEDRT